MKSFDHVIRALTGAEKEIQANYFSVSSEFVRLLTYLIPHISATLPPNRWAFLLQQLNSWVQVSSEPVFFNTIYSSNPSE